MAKKVYGNILIIIAKISDQILILYIRFEKYLALWLDEGAQY